ncbi:DUF982 domain-containing protein [Mesorhizobium sp. M0019]|uniref:DUF982 domain-containing protein n=1 Tax=Mesorhizobium sp. M0019 TaxID=2956845 RepID=UPI00333E0BFA
MIRHGGNLSHDRGLSRVSTLGRCACKTTVLRSLCALHSAGRGTLPTVERVAQAADILLNRWPTTTSKKHVAAQKACLGALKGLKKAHLARKAFVEVAKEADI